MKPAPQIPMFASLHHIPVPVLIRTVGDFAHSFGLDPIGLSGDTDWTAVRIARRDFLVLASGYLSAGAAEWARAAATCADLLNAAIERKAAA